MTYSKFFYYQIFLLFLLIFITTACERPTRQIASSPQISPTPSLFRTDITVTEIRENPGNYLTRVLNLDNDPLGIGKIEVTQPKSMTQWQTDYLLISVTPSTEFGRSIKIVENQILPFIPGQDLPADELGISSFFEIRSFSWLFQMQPASGKSYYTKPITATKTTDWAILLTPISSGDLSLPVGFYAKDENSNSILLTEIDLALPVEPSSVGAPVQEKEPFNWNTFLIGAGIGFVICLILVFSVFKERQTQETEGNGIWSEPRLIPEDRQTIYTQFDDQVEIEEDTRLRSREETRRVIKLIKEYFNENELRMMAHSLNLDYDNLPGNNKQLKVFELVDQLNREGRFIRLIEYCKKERSHVIWDG